jgi:hypothetical protein
VNSKVMRMWVNWNFVSRIDTGVKTKIIGVKLKSSFHVMRSDGEAEISLWTTIVCSLTVQRAVRLTRNAVAWVW